MKHREEEEKRVSISTDLDTSQQDPERKDLNFD